MAKSNATIGVERVGSILVFRGAGREIALEMGALSDEIKDIAIAHGLKQKIVDAAAISRNPETGASASAADKMDAVEAMVRRLASGQWNGAGGGAVGGVLLDALVVAYPAKSRDELREWLGTKDDKAKKALRASAKLRPIIVELESKRAANAEGDGLLDELG